MTPGNDPPHPRKRLLNGADLHEWRIQLAISAGELAKLIGVTERTIHRAEQSGTLGSKLKLGIELLQSRLAHGEINIPRSLEAASRRGRPRKVDPLVVSEDEVRYDTHWHGELRTGTDIRRWRESIGIYQKELAKLLGVDVSTLVRAEQSESPSSGLIYGAELLRKKVLLHEFDVAEIKKYRSRRGRPRKY